MTIPILFFKCKYCKRTFDNRPEAVACEKKHPRIKSARVIEYMMRDIYPLLVEVEFKNGDKQLYMLESEAFYK